MYSQHESGGAFNKQPVPRNKSLFDARLSSQGSSPFLVKPGGSSFGVFESYTTHITSSTQQSWEQQIAKPTRKISTKYEKLAVGTSITDISRANKALVKGGSDSLSPKSGVNTWRDKTYSDAGMMTASLFRINETSTAFGASMMGSTTHDVGTGIMSELLGKKWNAKSKGRDVPSMEEALPNLTRKFPQLDSADAMLKQGESALLAQIGQSRMKAAVAAARRGQEKGWSDLNEYVQRKFRKHGLGPVPKGWGEQL